MQNVQLDQVIQALQSIGIQPGDGLMIHSAVQFLGRPEGGVGMYLEAIQAIIGPQGTLAVPTFNFTFAKTGQYDPQETPSIGMGAFSEYVRQRPEARRTTHPMQSLAVIGHYAEELARLDTPCAFDPGSTFERMLELDFKLLLLGAEVHAIALVHYSEQRANVPYRYWKDFSGRILRRGARRAPYATGPAPYATGRAPYATGPAPHHTPSSPHAEYPAPTWEEHTYRMFVRDLQIDPFLRFDPIQCLLEERRQWRSAPLNYGKIAACRMADFVAATDNLLAADPWALVANRPQTTDNRPQTTDRRSP